MWKMFKQWKARRWISRIVFNNPYLATIYETNTCFRDCMDNLYVNGNVSSTAMLKIIAELCEIEKIKLNYNKIKSYYCTAHPEEMEG